MKLTYASEEGHWYALDGSPAYLQPNASKPGEFRPTTLRDARKLNLVPSVTTILRCIAKPGLERWKAMNILTSALTLPKLPSETVDAYADRVLLDAEEQSQKARDAGTAIHGAIEQALNGESVAENYTLHVQAAYKALSELRLDPSSGRAERSFACSAGYGGKLDLSGPDWIVDFKTKANWDDPKKLAYPEHCLQLSAYASGLGMDFDLCILANIFISTDEPGKFHVHRWTRMEVLHHYNMFRCIHDYWKLANNFGV